MKKLTKFRTFALLAFMALGFTSCNDDDDAPVVTPPMDNTITGIASRTPQLSILVQALTRAGLADDLQNSNSQLTAFAPTNDAFNAFFLSISSTTNVNNVDLPTLTKVLLNHVIASEIKSANVPAAGYVSTLSPFGTGTNSPTISMFVQKVGQDVFINGGTATTGVKVTTADVDASNGVVHIVNKVIAIPTIVDHVVANPDFDTLQAVVTSTGGTFGDQSAVLNILSGITATAPATLFAPNNTAFTNATTGTGFLTGANVTAANVTKTLQYHATTAGNVRSSALQNNQPVPMITNPVQNTTVILGTNTVDIRDTANNLSRVFEADIQCSNGVIHGVNSVLKPVFN
jgi:uncharacterized surface protein with fasciclin (FAS1) repeats